MIQQFAIPCQCSIDAVAAWHQQQGVHLTDKMVHLAFYPVLRARDEAVEMGKWLADSIVQCKAAPHSDQSPTYLELKPNWPTGSKVYGVPTGGDR
jgi:hypothetical protein